MNRLCNGYLKGDLSGNLCPLLCASSRNWSIIDFHQGASKRVIRLNANGSEYVFKSTKDFFEEFTTDPLDARVEEGELTDKVVEIVNEHMRLGYPIQYKQHLIKTLWPSYQLDHDGAQLSTADKASLWTLLQQDEFITFSILPLTRVTTKVLGSCGHFYATEPVLPFHMKSYYVS